MVTAMGGARLARAVGVAALAAALVAFPFLFRGPFPLHVMIMTFMFATLAVAWKPGMASMPDIEKGQVEMRAEMEKLAAANGGYALQPGDSITSGKSSW